jgi:TfoX/Sxy family transcriptional regulator of competence genes
MAFDEYLVDRVRRVFNDTSSFIEEKKMMGGLIFMVDKKMCVGINKDKNTGENRLMARIGKEEYQKALKEKGCREMDFTGKPMKGFVFIYEDGIDLDDDLKFWIQKALNFNKEAKVSKK